jgi:branched-chain amino acid transport system ATP-binding protein
VSLVLDNVTVRRGVGPVISGVSAEIRPGHITALVGSNGSGKTSLLEAISGIVTTSSGRIEIDGASVRSWSKRKRARAGLKHVEQGRMIFPSLTVRENFRLVATDRGALDDALELFPELEPRLDSASVLLSGGEQQMLVLARAFATKPSYLLLDEMSLGLAPVVFKRLIPTIKRIADGGVGVLLVEQFTHAALGVASEAIVVAGGRVTYHGDPAPLLTDDALLREAYLG